MGGGGFGGVGGVGPVITAVVMYRTVVLDL